LGIKIDPSEVKFYIFVVSSSRYKALKEGKEPTEDISGDKAKSLIESEGYSVIGKEIIKDGIYHVKEALKKGIRSKADFVLFIGGSGPTATDMTNETLTALIDKELNGFGEAFRRRSESLVGTRALLTNSMVGLIDKTIVIVLPGSPQAIELGLKDVIFPEVIHLYKLVKYGRH